MERRLTAILAADVVGYSRLVGADETGTLMRLQAFRREVIEPNIAKHSGRLFKIMGDGFLVEFASAVQAAACAIAIQAEAENLAAGLDVSKSMRLRIGIHVGDVIVDGDDLMGDGVNIAARLESIAMPGGISISRAVHDQVRDRIQAVFDDKGEIPLKNIARPVQVFALGATKGALNALPASKPALALPDKPSIAVLPFQNMSGDSEQDYFADGMVEDIITGLSRSKSLFVIARNSSFTYKGKAIDIKQVGRELGVRYVLEGSVRKSGERVRITGQLIDAATGGHLWANRFDSLLDDIFDLQDRVATSVIVAILPQLERAEIERAQKKPTENLQAYDYYLRGVACSYQNTREANRELLELTTAANLIDPRFALAYALAAFAFSQRKAFGWTGDLGWEVSEARRYAEQAIDLEKNDARVLAQAGFALGYVVGEVEHAAALIKQAIQLDPNLVFARIWMGWVNVYMGDGDAAVEQVETAMRLDPLDPRSYSAITVMAYAHFFAGRNDDALALAADVVRQRPNYITGQRMLMACHAMAGQVSEARRICETVMRIDPAQRISLHNSRAPFRQQDQERLAQAFRLSGMPE